MNAIFLQRNMFLETALSHLFVSVKNASEMATIPNKENKSINKVTSKTPIMITYVLAIKD